MASLYQNKTTGRYQIDVFGYGRIRLGYSKQEARAILAHVGYIEQRAKRGLNLPDDTKAWLDTAPGWVTDRLLELRLIDEQPHNVTIDDLVELELPSDSKKSSLVVRKYAIEMLRKYFRGDRLVCDITADDAIKIRHWMLTKAKKVRRKGKIVHVGLAKATVARRLKYIRSLFSAAVELEWIEENPFAEIKIGSQSNSAKARYIDKETSFKILDELPDAERRLAFALCRFGGMRFPSEVRELKWSGVDWHRLSMTFRTSKTEHHEGHERRTCPIFVELQPYMQEAWEAAKPGATYCCPTFRKRNARQVFAKQITGVLNRLDIPIWPRMFNNLRASRSTEVACEFGIKAESVWIGHGVDVAKMHYLMVTDDQWHRATGNPQNKASQQENPNPENKKISES